MMSASAMAADERKSLRDYGIEGFYAQRDVAHTVLVGYGFAGPNGVASPLAKVGTQLLLMFSGGGAVIGDVLTKKPATQSAEDAKSAIAPDN
nr:hypothetical protein [Oceanococcus sp. HetDA_MAG_MS8]